MTNKKTDEKALTIAKAKVAAEAAKVLASATFSTDDYTEANSLNAAFNLIGVVGQEAIIESLIAADSIGDVVKTLSSIDAVILPAPRNGTYYQELPIRLDIEPQTKAVYSFHLPSAARGWFRYFLSHGIVKVLNNAHSQTHRETTGGVVQPEIEWRAAQLTAQVAMFKNISSPYWYAGGNVGTERRSCLVDEILKSWIPVHHNSKKPVTTKQRKAFIKAILAGYEDDLRGALVYCVSQRMPKETDKTANEIVGQSGDPDSLWYSIERDADRAYDALVTAREADESFVDSAADDLFAAWA